MTKWLVVLLACWPTLLLAQPGGGVGRRDPFAGDTAGGAPRRGLTLGVLGYSGGDWEPSGAELGLLWPLGPSGEGGGARRWARRCRSARSRRATPC